MTGGTALVGGASVGGGASVPPHPVKNKKDKRIKSDVFFMGLLQKKEERWKGAKASALPSLMEALLKSVDTTVKRYPILLM